MKHRAKCIGFMYDRITNQTHVSFDFTGNALEHLVKLKDKELTVDVKKYTEKRSLDANAYYWILVTKIAQSIKRSNQYVHNLMLRRYGVLDSFDGLLWELWSPIDDDDVVMEYPDKHLLITADYKNGLRKYYIIRGSHTYSKDEFSNLLDGTITEAKLLGIPTETPESIERMKQLYEANKV